MEQLFLPISFLMMFLLSASLIWVLWFFFGIWAFVRLYRGSWGPLAGWVAVFFSAVIATLPAG